MKIYHLKEKAIQLTKESKELNSELNKTIEEVQSKCSHPYDYIVQIPMKSYTYIGSYLEEVRICTMCGTRETRACTGWDVLINSSGAYGAGKPLKAVKPDGMWKICESVFDTSL